MFFECCNKRFKASQVLFLYPDDGFINRALFIGKCPNCGSPKAILKEYDIVKDKWVIDRNKPKKVKNVNEWLNKLKNAVSSDIQNKKIKYGNKSNMAFIFGKTNVTPEGVIHSGYDWNGTLRHKTLIPVDVKM